MEQRTLVAFILMFLVLFGFNALMPKQKIKPRLAEEGLGIQPDTSAVFSDEIPKKIIDTDEQKIPKALDEKLQLLDNKELTVEFSNIGGTIKSVKINKYNKVLPITRIFNIAKYSNLPFIFNGYENGVVEYYAEDEEVGITKRYALSGNNDTIGLEIIVQNTTSRNLTKQYNIENFSIDLSGLNSKPDSPRDYHLFEYSASINNVITRKGNASKFSRKNNKQKQGQVDWAGFRDKYYCAVIRPEFTTTSHNVQSVNEKKLIIFSNAEKILLAPGESISYNAIAYIGPQDINNLKSYDMGFDKIMVFSNWGPLDWIAKTILSIANLLHKIIPSWGICIILIGIIINGAMYPLTLKSMRSMKKMQSLQPQTLKMKEQYKNNPQKQNKELMELYKEHNVNPFGGCLPMLFQMPVFIGVYQALWRSVMFKGESFLWIKDLSQPDRLLIFPFNAPIIGNELNILPILMMILMFFQQKLSTKNMATSDPNQLTQQRMMGIFFPLFLGFIFYKFASVLTLYFTVLYVFTMLTQLKMSKIKVMT